MSGLFISIEGGEGVGKTSFQSLLVDHLSATFPERGLLTTREPGGTPFAEAIRDLFLLESQDQEQWQALSELYLVSAARSQHMTFKIQPMLEQNGIVVCDRFIDSTRVYQGRVAGLEPEIVEAVAKPACQGYQPDVTFLLDCPTDIAQQRMSDRTKLTRMDTKGVEFHESVRQCFLTLAQQYSERIVVLDARQSTEALVLQAMQRLPSSP